MGRRVRAAAPSTLIPPLPPPPPTHTLTLAQVHRDLGVTATVLGLVQLGAFVWRPPKGHARRLVWEYGHAWIGRAAAIIAIANIY